MKKFKVSTTKLPYDAYINGTTKKQARKLLSQKSGLWLTLGEEGGGVVIGAHGGKE